MGTHGFSLSLPDSALGRSHPPRLDFWQSAQRRADRLAALRIPQRQRLFVTFADDTRAIGAEGHTEDPTHVAAQPYSGR